MTSFLFSTHHNNRLHNVEVGEINLIVSIQGDSVIRAQTPWGVFLKKSYVDETKDVSCAKNIGGVRDSCTQNDDIC